MRKKFLVKPRIQLKYLFWTLGVVVISFTAGYFLVESTVSSAVLNRSMGMAEWIVLRRQLRIGFGAILALVLILTGLENYFFFHSLIGPIYAFEKTLKRLAQGEWGLTTRTRQTDEFKELIDTFEEMKNNMVTRIENQEKALTLMERELDRLLSVSSPGDIEALRKRIQEIREKSRKKAA
jgi:methyl-accepting chemotaxis protein